MVSRPSILRSSIQNVAADDVFLDDFLNWAAGQFGGNVFFRRACRRVAVFTAESFSTRDLFDRLAVGLAQISLGDRAYALQCILRLGRGLGDIPGFLGAILRELDDRLDDRLEFPVSEHDGAEHDFLGKFARFRFDHEDGFPGAGDDHVEVGIFEVLGEWIEHILAADVTDPSAADRSR